MFYCPNCQGEIDRERREDGIHWVCQSCGGCTVNLSVLRKTRTSEFITELWAKVRNGDGVMGRGCPACEQCMLTVRLLSAGSWEEFDACKVCQFVWFDPDEFERTPQAEPVKPKVPERELPQRAKEALAMYEVQRIAERAGPEPVDEWKKLPAIFGLPVERDSDSHERKAWATWTVCVLIFLVSLWAFRSPHDVFETFALVPDEAFRLGGLTLITSFFLHGGWVHLLGNLYFLLVFGDNVENRIGWRRMLWLLLTATLTGHFLHIIGELRSSVPCVGASGGISGVLVFYALAFPEKKISILWHYYLHGMRWIEMSAWTAFGLWCGLQLLIVMQQLAGWGHVSALAHLGGVIGGGVLWFVWRETLPKEKCTPDLMADVAGDTRKG